MKLKEYLNENKLTQNKFLNELEKETGHVLSQGGLSKYILAQRIPSLEIMRVLRDFTSIHGKGRVEPNDFYL